MLKVDKAKEEDVKKIARLEEELFYEESWTEYQLFQELKNKFSEVYVIKKKEEVLGYLICRIIPPEAEVLRLGVKTSYQRKGLGSLLMRNFLNKSKNNNISAIFLEVSIFNKKAYNFYRKFGFQELYYRKGYYKASDAIIMKKFL